MTLAEWLAVALGAANLIGVPVARFVYTQLSQRMDKAEQASDVAQARADEAFERVAALALSVADKYASNAYVGAVETRLMDQLRQANGKLDQLLLERRATHG